MSELSWRPIKILKVRFERTIASFNSETDNDQPYPITIHYDKYVIRLNASIIILLIKSSEPEAWSYRGWRLI